MNDKNQELVETLYRELVSGDMRQYRKFYIELKEEYFGFARKLTTEETIIADSYHDAFIALYENIVERKLLVLTSSLKTYVFSIGKYSILNKLRKANKEIYDEQPEHPDPAFFEPDEDNSRLILLKSELRNLGESCRKILILFYYRRNSIDSIVTKMNYKNANTAKAHKSRCMKQLREMIFEKTKTQGNE